MELEQGTILVEGKPSKLQMLKRAQEIGKYGTNKTVYVLDTSALLAHYLDEEGTDLVSSILLLTPSPSCTRRRTECKLAIQITSPSLV